jgi:hypothetical protein
VGASSATHISDARPSQCWRAAACWTEDHATEWSEPSGDQASKKRRNPWIWICAVLALAAAGLLIWALTIQSDLDSTLRQQTRSTTGHEAGWSAAHAHGDDPCLAGARADPVADGLPVPGENMHSSDPVCSSHERRSVVLQDAKAMLVSFGAPGYGIAAPRRPRQVADGPRILVRDERAARLAAGAEPPR